MRPPLSKRNERRLGGQEGAGLRRARELDRRALPVLEHVGEELPELWQLGRMDLRDRRRKQLLARVAKHGAAGTLDGGDAVVERIDDEGGVTGALEELVAELPVP
jgi:hypothetical protein